MNHSLRLTTAFLDVYAGLLAIQHGVFEILLGDLTPAGEMIQAIGALCQPELVRHACFRGITLIPSLFIRGVVAVIARLSVAAWSAAFVQRRCGGLPYNRLGQGPRPLVIFQGLMFENKPQSG